MDIDVDAVVDDDDDGSFKWTFQLSCGVTYVR